MLASSNVNVGVLGKNDLFFQPEKVNVNLRRNYMILFDSLQNESVKIDCSLGVSLVDRDA